jgi:hypothetical protein
MIDLLGKVRYFSNLKGFPPFADKHRFIRTQPIASNKWPALSPLLQRPCPPPPTSLRLKTMGRRRCGVKSSGKEAVWNSSPFEDHLPTLVELQYSGDVTDLRRYPQSTICKGWDRTSCRDQCPRGPSQGPPRDHRAWHYSDQAKKGTVAGRMNTMSTTARPTPTTAAPTTTARVDLFEPESEEDKIEAPAEVMNPDTHLATPTAGDNKRVANSSTSTTAANETAKGALADLATPTAGNNERVANSSTSTTAANETKGSPTLVPLLLPPTKPPRVHFLISRLRRLATMKGSPTLAPLLLPPTKLPRVHSLISDHGPTTGSKYEAARATRSPYRPPRGL